jgi:hypothetical protein
LVEKFRNFEIAVNASRVRELIVAPVTFVEFRDLSPPILSISRREYGLEEVIGVRHKNYIWEFHAEGFIHRLYGNAE